MLNENFYVLSKLFLDGGKSVKNVVKDTSRRHFNFQSFFLKYDLIDMLSFLFEIFKNCVTFAKLTEPAHFDYIFNVGKTDELCRYSLIKVPQALMDLFKPVLKCSSSIN